MGSYLSYLTAARLKSGHGMEPVHMFVSGAPGPFVGTFEQYTIIFKIRTRVYLVYV